MDDGTDRPSGPAPWIELYDGTVDPRQLGRWLALLCVLGIAVFLGANALIGRLAEPDIARGYALLAGLVAIVAGAAVSVVRVRPKRTVTLDRLDEKDVADVAQDLAALSGGTLDVGSAPAAVIEEMRRGGLDQLLRPEPGTRSGV